MNEFQLSLKFPEVNKICYTEERPEIHTKTQTHRSSANFVSAGQKGLLGQS